MGFFTYICIHSAVNKFSFMVKTNEAKQRYEKCRRLTKDVYPKVQIAVNIAKLWTGEISYWIINGICNQHYDNQRGHQVENNLKGKNHF